jgi:hypothetical protein
MWEESALRIARQASLISLFLPPDFPLRFFTAWRRHLLAHFGGSSRARDTVKTTAHIVQASRRSNETDESRDLWPTNCRKAENSGRFDLLTDAIGSMQGGLLRPANVDECR